MEKYSFDHSSTIVYYNDSFETLEQIVPKEKSVLFVDEHVYNLHLQHFAGWRTVLIKAGESSKQQEYISGIVDELIAYEADRSSWIIGIGGGVVTDITGYVASIYMRGIRFGFVPTSLLGLVDASIGGKNGIDVKLYKNLLGTINQPAFILHDHKFLQTLPRAEFVNGMAEIIKHACISDRKLFDELEALDLETLLTDKLFQQQIISRNVQIKLSIVQKDEFEKKERKLLNFGHTLGHAIETIAGIAHGKAVAIGMAMAAKLSIQFTGFQLNDYNRLINLLSKYDLPVQSRVAVADIIELVKLDKKRRGSDIDMILLNNIGDASIYSIRLDELKTVLS